MIAQMCTADDLLGGEPCGRIARFKWQPESMDHPVFLCNFHAEPFDLAAEREIRTGRRDD